MEHPAKNQEDHKRAQGDQRSGKAARPEVADHHDRDHLGLGVDLGEWWCLPFDKRFVEGGHNLHDSGVDGVPEDDRVADLVGHTVPDAIAAAGRVAKKAASKKAKAKAKAKAAGMSDSDSESDGEAAPRHTSESDGEAAP